ncbi:glycosyltransferase family 2 protein [Paracoccus ravus]|uniref:glycosyltransferase family 2 protein n=1 Tax=Paracoccus ravus TaxID=2447760 RepID=UPI00106EB287|nr:glycosyltransferase family 2 protein [Paracoccus ravus]
MLLIVIPTLNEATHIAQVLSSALGFCTDPGDLIVVADGGSEDGTRLIVRQMAVFEPRVHLLDNPRKLQAAGVNLAVSAFGTQATWLLRMDAHSAYPDDFAKILLDEARGRNADSVVVSMVAQGEGFWHRAIAAAQNSRIGNGGSAHRSQGPGKWVSHGHHALMRISAFREIGGYDPGFTHNEDAELDHRLTAAGFRIWLTGRTGLIYFPRRNLAALIRQYHAFGRGRRRNLAKHRAWPGARQTLVAVLAPALLCVTLAPLWWGFAIPFALWMAGCLVSGAAIALRQNELAGCFSGLFAGAMHLAWSTGYWRQWLFPDRRLVGRRHE